VPATNRLSLHKLGAAHSVAYTGHPQAEFLPSPRSGSPFKGLEATTQSLSKAYWWKMAVTAGLALGLGIYVEMMINARHAAWWDFCFGEEG
jgi:hypothetical protein